MQNLQDLFDFYKETEPTKGKLSSAVNVLIHISQALKVAGPEQVGPDKYAEIIPALDEYFPNSIDKAIQDKSILGEMIGRYGPRDGWENPLRALLNSADSNLRQYVFQALDFIGERSPKFILPYIEKYRSSDDLLMRNVAAILVGKLFCAGRSDFLKPVFRSWQQQGGKLFINEIASQIKSVNGYFSKDDYEHFKKWLQEELQITILS